MDQNSTSLNLQSQRVVSLDAFRGFIMFSMLLHTFGLNELSHLPVVGFIYNQLKHAPWVGFHFEDIILPSFLFIIGVSMGLSDMRRHERGEPSRTRINHAVKRALTLFGFGFFLSWYSAGKLTIGPGVLQVLGLSYIGAFLFVGRSIKTQTYAIAVLLFVYWFFIFIIPVPEAGRNSYIVFKNLVYLIDNTLTGSTSRWGYLYTIITSIAVVNYGSIIGKLLVRRPTHGQFMKTLAIAGVIGIATGLALHPVVPIIKRMFTSSYTLFTCGLISFIFLMFYWLIDVKGHKKWFFFFIVFGVNSIFVYMLNGLFRQWLVRTAGIFINPSEVVFGAWIHPAKECIRILIEWLICWWLLSKRIFMKI